MLDKLNKIFKMGAVFKNNMLNYDDILKYLYYYNVYIWIDMQQAYADKNCLVTESEY